MIGENQVNYKVHIDIEQSAVMVNDDHVGVKITLTSPLLRDEGGLVSNESISNTNSTVDTKNDDTILLPRKPCLKVRFKCSYYLLYLICIIVNV